MFKRHSASDFFRMRIVAQKEPLALRVLLLSRDPTTYALASDLMSGPCKNANQGVRNAMASLRAAELAVFSNAAEYLPELSSAYPRQRYGPVRSACY